MSSAQNPDADREDYVVSVVEFAGDRGAATAALQRVFGLEQADASAILDEVPVAVRRGVNRIRAEYFRRALELSGARVEVRDGDGEVVSAATAPARTQVSGPLTARGQMSGPISPRVQPSGPIAQRAQLSAPVAPGPNEPTTGVQLRSASQPLAASSQPQLGKTIAFGSTPANDPGRASTGGWGDFQPFKSAPTAPSAAKPATPAAPEAAKPAKPQPSAEEAWALSLEAERGPLDSPLQNAGAEARLELASIPSPGHAANRNRVADGPPVLELDSDSDKRPPGRALELDVAPPTLPTSERELLSRRDAARSPDRESATRHDAIPAGEHWRAPGTETLAKARRKQVAEALDSGFGDAPPPSAPAASPRPKPGPRPASGGLMLNAAPAMEPADARAGVRPQPPAPFRSPPITRPRPESRSNLELGFWEATRLGFSGTSISWIAKIAGASVVLAGLAQLSVRAPALGLPLLLVGLTCLLGLCGEYHRHVFWAAATRESTLRERPALSVATLMRDGIHLAGLALITQGLLWFWLGGQLVDAHRPVAIVFSPTLWVLGFGPGFYWPIALACAAARNRASSVWDVGLGLRALGRAPAQVATAVLVTAAAFCVSLMIGAAIVSATALDPTLALFIAAGLPIAISHALAAALMGRVVHAHPDLFE